MLQVKNLTKYYDRLPALDGLNFGIETGEFVSVIGPSGCGKTTLLKIIGGLIKPTAGEIKIRGNPAGFALKQGQIGFVFQNPVLLPWRNIAQNIELPLEILGNKNPKNSARDLIKLVGLEGFENYYPNQLSGGMQQRVAITRALIFEPQILLMDEPFGSLDEITRNYMGLELLRIWQAEETKTSTVVFVTHSISEAVFLSDRVIILSKRPAKIKEIVNVDLSRPRIAGMKFSNKYFDLMKCLREKLKLD